MNKLHPDCPFFKSSPAARPHPENDSDCFSCWQREQLKPSKVILNNAKYCKLYPKCATDELDEIIPDFDHCKTLYTKCDYQLEKNVHDMILKIEKQFKQHNILTDKEMLKQKDLIDAMWVSSQRYLILDRGGACVKLYPEIISFTTEQRALCKFHKNLRKIHESNYCLSKSLEAIRTNMAELETRCAQLDYTIESPFLDGAYYLRSLKYIRTTINDLFQYFHHMLCQLKCWGQLLDPGDSVAIEDYMTLIRPNKDYENNLEQLTKNCRCMRSKRTDCISNFKPC